MVTNPLASYIVLVGYKRLPELEREIFADKELTDLYLQSLCRDPRWRTGMDNCHDSVFDPAADIAEAYAHEVLHAAWPEAESIIMQDGECIYLYARWTLKRRWLEAEAVLASDARSKLMYEKYFRCEI